jgi:hypothetical protein
MSASTSATNELSPSHGADLDCDTKLRIQHQAGNTEKNLVVFRVQTELIGKVAAMVIAHTEHKPEQLCIGEESWVVSDVVQKRLRSCRHCKETQAKMKHLLGRVLGGPN